MAELIPTPAQTVGPFYGYALPFDKDCELVPPGSAGAIRFYGTVYDGAGEPVPDALLEIRQADAEGNLVQREGSFHRRGRFTGWGRASTNAVGDFSFITVEPAAAAGASAAFISVLVMARGLLDGLFTRAYLPASAEALAADALLSSFDEQQRAALMIDREPTGDLHFDVHLQGERETPFLLFPRHR